MTLVNKTYNFLMIVVYIIESLTNKTIVLYNEKVDG